MSEFDLAIDFVLRNEGGFVNDPNDPGGATSYGISLRWLKTVGQLDADITGDGQIDLEDIRELTKEKAKLLYKKYWWDKYGYEKINDQSVANKILDMSINMGAVQAHKIAQRALFSINGYNCIKVDGIIGLNTLTEINDAISLIYLAALKSEMAGFYRELIATKKQFEIYRNGWLKRAYLG